MISILGSILGVINSFTWLLWGCVCLNKDLLHVVVANTIGLGLCISQVVVYYYYKKKNDFGSSVYKSDVNVNDNNNNKSRKTSVDSMSKNQNNPAIFEF